MEIFVAEDEQEIAQLIRLYLENEGYQVESCASGKAALARLTARPYDLALLDVMLPETDGFALCRAIRQRYAYPVILLTARTGDMDKINGLAIGADDYITKPFNPLEVMARVKAQLRRANSYNAAAVPAPAPDRYEYRGLAICRDTHEVTLYGAPVKLTPTEFEILWVLFAHSGQVVSCQQLFESVWHETGYDCRNAVMVHIRRIREKLGEPPRKPRFIQTVWGVGYKIEKI